MAGIKLKEMGVDAYGNRRIFYAADKLIVNVSANFANNGVQPSIDFPDWLVILFEFVIVAYPGRLLCMLRL